MGEGRRIYSREFKEDSVRLLESDLQTVSCSSREDSTLRSSQASSVVRPRTQD